LPLLRDRYDPAHLAQLHLDCLVPWHEYQRMLTLSRLGKHPLLPVEAKDAIRLADPLLPLATGVHAPAGLVAKGAVELDEWAHMGSRTQVAHNAVLHATHVRAKLPAHHRGRRATKKKTQIPTAGKNKKQGWLQTAVDKPCGQAVVLPQCVPVG